MPLARPSQGLLMDISCVVTLCGFFNLEWLKALKRLVRGMSLADHGSWIRFGVSASETIFMLARV
jgi:hypothetical protein